jgi:uncharacterized protein YoxC
VLTPGSPTPFEEGLRGIGDAVVELANRWSPLANSLGDVRIERIKNLGKAFREMGKGVTALADSMKQLTALSASAGAGGLSGFNLTPMLADMERLVTEAMTKLQQITDKFGYNQIKKLKQTAARLKSILESVSVDLSGIKAYKLPDLSTYFGTLFEVFDRAASMVNAIRARFGDKVITTMGEATDSIGRVFGILNTKLDVEAPRANFLDVLTVFLTAVEAGGALIIPWLERIRNTYGQTLIDEMAALSQSLTGVFDVLNVGKLFDELTTEEKLAEGAKKLPLVDVLTKILADLNLAADLILPSLQALQDKWGGVLDGVQDVSAKIKAVFGDVADAYKSAVDFASGDALDLNALATKLGKLSQATGIVLAGVTAPTFGALPGLAGAAAGAGGAATTPMQLTVNIYGADGARQGSYTETVNDARQVDIRLSESLGAA